MLFIRLSCVKFDAASNILSLPSEEMTELEANKAKRIALR